MPDFSKYRHTIAFLAIILVSGITMAISPYDVQRLNLNIERKRLADYTYNPATMYFRDSVSVSSFGVSGKLLRSSKSFMQQLGTGHTLASISAYSYTRLGSKAVVWGSAEFRTGSYRNIKWNDCIDYLRISPYVLGDEVGGNLSTRQYTFSGGYAHNFGKYTVGAYADYRAEIAYRNHDPRVKTIVSDLNLKLGASYSISARYIVGLNAGINVYNQNCDLDFYNPLNDINTYTLTGLGTFYKRFMGNTNKNSGYTSVGYMAGVQCLPIKGGGCSAVAMYNRFRMSQQLRSFNNITLGFTDNDIVTASIAYRTKLMSDVEFQPRIAGCMFSRKGTENLFGTSAGASYDKIGSRSPYSLHAATISLELPMQITCGATQFTIEPCVGYKYHKEKYNEPFRRIAFNHVVPQVKLQCSSLYRGWLWDMNINGSYSHGFGKQFSMTDFDSSNTLDACVENNYSMMSAGSMGIKLDVGISRRFDKVIMKLSIYYDVENYRVVDAYTHNAGVSVSALF